jgi:hypothetical protein
MILVGGTLLDQQVVAGEYEHGYRQVLLTGPVRLHLLNGKQQSVFTYCRNIDVITHVGSVDNHAKYGLQCI